MGVEKSRSATLLNAAAIALVIVISVRAFGFKPVALFLLVYFLGWFWFQVWRRFIRPFWRTYHAIRYWQNNPQQRTSNAGPSAPIQICPVCQKQKPCIHSSF